MNKKEKLLKDWNGGISRGAQRRLAAMLKLNEASVSSWLSGRATPSESNLIKMSRIFNKSSQELEGIFIGERKNVSSDINEVLLNSGAKDIPVFTAKPQAGDFFTLDETPEVFLPIKKAARDKAFAVKVQNDAMAEAGNPKESLYEGDYAIVIPSSNIKNGMVVLAGINGKFVLRRCYKTANEVELTAANKKYKPCKLSLYEVEIMGYVAHIHRPVTIKSK